MRFYNIYIDTLLIKTSRTLYYFKAIFTNSLLNSLKIRIFSRKFLFEKIREQTIRSFRNLALYLVLVNDEAVLRIDQMRFTPLRGGVDIPVRFIFELFHADAAGAAINQQGHSIARFFDGAGISRTGLTGLGIPSGHLDGFFLFPKTVFDAINFPWSADIFVNRIHGGFGVGVGVDFQKQGSGAYHILKIFDKFVPMLIE
jgi:hypothetical protein